MRFFFKKLCILKAFVKNPCFVRFHQSTKGDFIAFSLAYSAIGTLGQLGHFGTWYLWAIGTFWQLGPLAIGTFGQLKIQLVDLFSFSNNWRQLDHLRSKNAQSKNKVYGFFRNLQGD